MDYVTAGQILTVKKVSKDNDGTWIIQCPHCQKVVGLPDGPIRGEQFQHKHCNGWFDVSNDAVAVLP